MDKDQTISRQAKSFGDASEGITHNIKTQPHFRVHIFFAILAIILGLVFSVDKYEWIIILIMISATLAAETINTAIEETCNLLHPELHPSARLAKHSAAAAVLIMSVASGVIGAIIFLPKIIS